MKKIIVTGGAGYIGSHTVVELIKSGYEPIIFDNLEYGSKEVPERVEKLTGFRPKLIIGDLKNYNQIFKALKSEKFDGVIHFAAYKNVVESINEPEKYYENNILGTLNLLKVLKESKIDKLIFSSTCAVYGTPEKLPVNEDTPLNPLSPYPKTKLACEYMIDDFQKYGIDSIRLRYFNASGAHPSGLLGENPEVLLNIIPRIFNSAFGYYDLKIFGNKFNTRDGYQIRDYIHVVDLADAHIKALKYLTDKKGSFVFNIGTGKGTTNLELIKEVENVTNKKVNFKVTEANPGEAIEIYADNTLAKKELGWKASYDYHDIISHAWNWYKNN